MNRIMSVFLLLCVSSIALAERPVTTHTVQSLGYLSRVRDAGQAVVNGYLAGYRDRWIESVAMAAYRRDPSFYDRAASLYFECFDAGAFDIEKMLADIVEKTEQYEKDGVRKVPLDGWWSFWTFSNCGELASLALDLQPKGISD